MVLEAFTALSLASNIVQFVDFGSRLLSKNKELSRSVSGASAENEALETISNSLTRLSRNLKISRTPSRASLSRHEADLEELADRCCVVAGEVLSALARLKVHENRTKWTTLRQALRVIMNASKIEEMKKLMRGFREQLTLCLLGILK